MQMNQLFSAMDLFGDVGLFDAFEEGEAPDSPVAIRGFSLTENEMNNVHYEELLSENAKLKQVVRHLSRPANIRVKDCSRDGPIAHVMLFNHSLARKYRNEIESFFFELCSRKRRNSHSNSMTNIQPNYIQYSSPTKKLTSRRSCKQIELSKKAFQVFSSVQMYEKFIIDQIGDPPSLDSSPRLCPLYDCTNILPLEGETECALFKDQLQRVCFNCGRSDHQLKECEKPRNPRAVSERRRKFMNGIAKANGFPLMRLDTGRYHQEDETEHQARFAQFKPGVISPLLQKALGMKEEDLPPYVYYMRILGYPPGHLQNAQVIDSGLSLYEEEGEINGCGQYNEYVPIDTNRLIGYPGFNQPPLPGQVDRSCWHNAPPMDPDCSIENLISYFETRNKLHYNRKAANDQLGNVKEKKIVGTDFVEVDMDMDTGNDGDVDACNCILVHRGPDKSSKMTNENFESEIFEGNVGTLTETELEVQRELLIKQLQQHPTRQDSDYRDIGNKDQDYRVIDGILVIDESSDQWKMNSRVGIDNADCVTENLIEAPGPNSEQSSYTQLNICNADQHAAAQIDVDNVRKSSNDTDYRLHCPQPLSPSHSNSESSTEQEVTVQSPSHFSPIVLTKPLLSDHKNFVLSLSETDPVLPAKQALVDQKLSVPVPSQLPVHSSTTMDNVIDIDVISRLPNREKFAKELYCIGLEMGIVEELDLPMTKFEYNFQDPAFGNRILSGLNELRLESKFFDMTICVEKKRFMCHRAVLASASDYFRGMFGGMMKESFTDEVTIFDVDANTMYLLIEFCYTGHVIITTDNAERLIKAADLFQFSTIKEACGEFFATNLHPTNCLNIEQFAKELSCYDLAKAAFAYTLQHIVEVTPTKDFVNLKFDKVYEILSHRQLNIDKEEHAYEICLFWIKNDTSVRIKYFERLMSVIRFPFIRRIYMLTKIETNTLIRDSKFCLEFIRESKALYTSSTDRHQCPSIRIQPRPSTGLAEVLITLGGCDNNCDEIRNVICINPMNNHSRCLARSPREMRRGFSAVVLDNDIFVTGGSDGMRISNAAWRYKSQLNEWVEISPMLQPREYHASVSLKNALYIVSAEGCERYSPDDDIWEELTQMPYAVNNCSLAACCNKIFCIGSAVMSNALTLQVYSPESGSWTVLECKLPNLCQSSFVPTVSSISGILYFIHEDTVRVIAYDPDRNLWVDRISSMLQLHLGGCVTQFEGKLFVSGGYDERFGLSDAVDIYDPKANSWSLAAKLPHPMFWHNCVSLFRYVSAPRGHYYYAPASLHDFSPIPKDKITEGKCLVNPTVFQF